MKAYLFREYVRNAYIQLRLNPSENFEIKALAKCKGNDSDELLFFSNKNKDLTV
jgi:hypothetical protein